MKTRRDIMIRAHQIAKALKGDYIACLSEGLRIAWEMWKAVNYEIVNIKFDQDVKFILHLDWNHPRFTSRKNDIKRYGGKWNNETKNWEITRNTIPDYLTEFVIDVKF